MADIEDGANNQPVGYVPPKVWIWDSENGGQFANINRPTSGATHDKVLPVGKHPLQLYSMGTPNGVRSRSCSKSCWRWVIQAPNMMLG
jgi:GSH-dependent disulfide-bond oxidoreductase